MVAITFDTLAYSKKLRRVGGPEKQAEVQAEALATKQDLYELEGHLSKRIDDISNSLEKLSYKLTIRLGGLIVVGVLVLAAIIKI